MNTFNDLYDYINSIHNLKYLASITADEKRTITQAVVSVINKTCQISKDNEIEASEYYEAVVDDNGIHVSISLSILPSCKIFTTLKISFYESGYKIKFDNPNNFKNTPKLLNKTENEDNISKFVKNVATIQKCNSYLNNLKSISLLIKEYIDIQSLIAKNNPDDYLLLSKKLRTFQRRFNEIRRYSNTSKFLFEEISLAYQQQNYQCATYSIFPKGQRKKHNSFSFSAMIPTYEDELINVLLDDFYAYYGYGNDTKCIIKIRKYVGTSKVPIIKQIEI